MARSIYLSNVCVCDGPIKNSTTWIGPTRPRPTLTEGQENACIREVITLLRYSSERHVSVLSPSLPPTPLSFSSLHLFCLPPRPAPLAVRDVTCPSIYPTANLKEPHPRDHEGSGQQSSVAALTVSLSLALPAALRVNSAPSAKRSSSHLVCCTLYVTNDFATPL